jgi:hypothetical protein
MENSTLVVFKPTKEKGTFLVHGGGFGLTQVLVDALEKEGDRINFAVRGGHWFNGVFGSYEFSAKEKDIVNGGFVRIEMNRRVA